MDEQNKSTPKTSISLKTTKLIKARLEKPLDVPTHIAHPRKEKFRLGKFGITEGSKKFPEKPSE